MATIGKRKQPRKNPLGMPPTAEEARNNLQEPEAAPAVAAKAVVTPAKETVAKKPAPPKKQGRAVAKKNAEPVTDGRSLRKTGRTEQFATRVKPDFKQELFAVAKKTGKNYNVILEESLELYKQQINA